MADSKVTITQGTGTDIDTRTNEEGEHRQVIVIGDPSVTAGVAPVHSSYGLSVDVRNIASSITVPVSGTVTANAGSGTMAVNFSPSEPTVKVKTGETIAVYFSPSNPSVNATFSGSISAVPETGSGDSIYDETKNALVVTPHSEGTFAVYFSPSNPSVNATFSGSIEAVPVTGSGAKLYDDSVDALKICDGGNKISIDDGGSSITVDGGVDINNRPDVNRVFNVIDGTISIGDISKGTQTNDVKITLDGERVDVQRVYNLVDGTVSVGNTVSIQDGGNVISVDDGGSSLTVDGNVSVDNLFTTATISGSVAGSLSAVSEEGGVVVNPETGRNIKVYAVALTTTAQVHTIAKFTDGAGNEKWRYALQAQSAGIAGANLAVTPPAYLFATGVGNTLCLITDSGSLIHYSISYFKESG